MCFLLRFYFLHYHDSVSLANILLALLYFTIKIHTASSNKCSQIQVYTSYICFKRRKKLICTDDLFWLQASQACCWCSCTGTKMTQMNMNPAVIIHKSALFDHIEFQSGVCAGKNHTFLTCLSYGFELVKLPMSKISDLVQTWAVLSSKAMH